jgi:hypothetical protein
MIQLVCLSLLLSLSRFFFFLFFLFMHSMCLPQMTFYREHDANDNQTGKKEQVVIGSFSEDF